MRRLWTTISAASGKPGTVAIWDNRSSWHNAINDYGGYRRRNARITLTGEALAA
jgi:taurine dioxygenase